MDENNSEESQFDWWVDPMTEGSPLPDLKDWQDTQKCIERNCTPQEQQQITIYVREKKFDDSWN